MSQHNFIDAAVTHATVVPGLATVCFNSPLPLQPGRKCGAPRADFTNSLKYEPNHCASRRGRFRPSFCLSSVGYGMSAVILIEQTAGTLIGTTLADSLAEDAQRATHKEIARPGGASDVGDGPDGTAAAVVLVKSSAARAAIDRTDDRTAT
jgi:hypothetical protein